MTLSQFRTQPHVTYSRFELFLMALIVAIILCFRQEKLVLADTTITFLVLAVLRPFAVIDIQILRFRSAGANLLAV